MSKIGIQTHGVNHKIMRKGLKTGGRAALRFGSGRTNLLEQLGRVEAEPSNPNRRAEISRVHGELNRGYAKGGRAGHAAGSIVKGGAKVAKKILDFVKTGKYIDKHGTKINVPKVVKRLKKQGSPHLETYEESMKAEGGRIGKAAGGRIGLKHGFQILGGGIKGKPHSTREGRDAAGRRKFKRWVGEDPSPRPRDFLQKARRMARAGRRRDFQTHGRDVPTMAAEGGRIGFRKGGTDKKWMQKVSASIKKRGTKGKCTPITKPGCTGRAKALAKTFKKIAAKRKA